MNDPVRHCPTCTCTIRRRFTITPELLESVAAIHRFGGIQAVEQSTGRSRSQAYRLVAMSNPNNQRNSNP